MTTIGDILSSILFFNLDISKLFRYMIISLLILTIFAILIIILRRTDISIIISLFKGKRKNPKDIFYVYQKRINNSELEGLNLLFNGKNYSENQSEKTNQPTNIIEVLCLPEWSDVSTYDTELQKQEAYNKQIEAMFRFIASSNEINIPF